MKSELIPRRVCSATYLVWILIALIGISVAGIEIWTLGHLKASLISDLQLHGPTITLASIIATLKTTIRAIDLMFLSLLAGCLLAMVIGEIRQSLITNFFEWIFTSNRRVYLLLLLLSTVGTLYYFVPGYILAADASSHVPGGYFVTYAIKNGRSLLWWNYWSLGGPSFLQFSGPLYFVLAGLMGALLGDATIGTKVTLWALHVLSGFATFFYVKQISNSAKAAFVAGLIYTYAFAHTHLILWKGALPQALLFLFFPLALYFLEKYLRGNGQQRSLCAFTAISALLIISHPGMGIYSGWFISLYIIVQICLSFKELRGKITPLVISGVASVAMSSFVVLPMRYETSYTVAAGVLAQSPFPGLGLPTMRTIKQALLWYNAATGEGHDNVVYLGITSVVLAFIGLYYFVPRRNRTVISLASVLVAAFIIRATHIREVIFVLTAISALAGMGVLALEEITEKNVNGLGKTLASLVGPKRARLTVVVMAFVLVDLGPTTIQSLYRADKEYILDMGRKLEKTIGSARIVEGEANENGLFVNIGSGGSPLLYFRVPLVFGPYLIGPWTQNYAAILVSQAFAELNKERKLSEITLQGLRLFNVRYILINSRFKYVLPDLITSSGYSLNEAVPAIEISAPNFVWFSQAISSEYKLPPDLERHSISNEDLISDAEKVNRYTNEVYRVVNDMELDGAKGVAKRLFVKNTQGYKSIPSSNREPEIKVSRLFFGSSRVDLDVNANVSGFLQLSFPYYPYIAVFVNGEKVEPLVGAIPFVVVPINSGKNKIILMPYLSALRKYSLLLSGLAAFVLLVYFMRRHSVSVTK